MKESTNKQPSEKKHAPRQHRKHSYEEFGAEFEHERVREEQKRTRQPASERTAWH